MMGPTILPFNGRTPVIHDSAFIAPGAVIIGDVEIGPQASIWYNCVVRGDVNRIRIGARSNVQDGTVIHCDSAASHPPLGFPTLIGEDVLIGHMAMIHGCVLESRAFVALGATVMNGAVIESDAMLGAGALLTPGKRIGSGELWAGRPAKFLRRMDAAMIAGNLAGVASYVQNAAVHKRAVEDANAAAQAAAGQG